MKFAIATSLGEALAAVAEGARPVAGGSDLVVGARHGKAPLPESLIAIDRIDELASVTPIEGGGIRIGALVTHANLMTEPLIVDRYSSLADAAALVGSPATRNVGTLGGNVMNASPAMDTGAPLLAMAATVDLRSIAGSRTVTIADLWTGPGQTIARADELCVAINLPSQAATSGSAYVRLEYRRAMEIAVVGAAGRVDLDDEGNVTAAAVALTAVAPTIVGVDGIAEALAGRRLDSDALADVAAAASEQATPISDLRASDRYRRHTIGVMASRAIEAAGRRAAGEVIAIPVNRSLGIGAAS